MTLTIKHGDLKSETEIKTKILDYERQGKEIGVFIQDVCVIHLTKYFLFQNSWGNQTLLQFKCDGSETWSSIKFDSIEKIRFI